MNSVTNHQSTYAAVAVGATLVGSALYARSNRLTENEAHPSMRQGCYPLLVKGIATCAINALSAGGYRTELDQVTGHALDMAKVGHGDAVFPGNTSSGRYVVSQWQRGAVGAMVIPLLEDASSEPCVILGLQGGVLRVPQGYGELPCPSDDRSGLKLNQHGASRLHHKTRDYVEAEQQGMRGIAQRELKEETNVSVNLDDLVLQDVIDSPPERNKPYRTVGIYSTNVKGINLGSIRTIDDEFADDIDNTQTIRIKDIKQTLNEAGQSIYSAPYRDTKGQVQFIALEPGTYELIQKAIQTDKHQ